MAPTLEEQNRVKNFAKVVAGEGESLVNMIQFFFEGLDQEVYEQDETVREILEFQSELDDAWRMLKGSIPD